MMRVARLQGLLRRIQGLVPALLVLPVWAGEGAASPPSAPPPPPSRVLYLGSFLSCQASTCNCTSNPIQSTFCRKEEFGFEVGGEVIEVKTGQESSQCDTLTIPPGKCISQCYEFDIYKSCGWFFTTYTTTQVAMIYFESAANCSIPFPARAGSPGGSQLALATSV